MCVTRQLKIHTMVDGVVNLHRLVCEQHTRPRPIPVTERTGEVRPLPLVLAGHVVHTREVEVGQLRTGVLQRVQPEAAHLLDPLLGAGEVLVVAGDEERAVTRRQLGERAAAAGPRSFTLPSTRSPTTAIRSGWVELIVSTTFCAKPRPSTGPRWMSLTTAIR